MKPRLALWSVAGGLACLLHAAAAAAFLWTAPVETDRDEDGAPAIEIGIELAAPREEPTELPPGPAADDAAASTASAARTAVPETTEELPKETPVESEEPDRTVALETPQEKKEAQPEPAPERSQESADSAASEAAAAPSVETAKEAPASAAPTPGSGTSAVRVRTTWQRQLIGHLNRNKRYPAGAERREAEITVTFTLDRTGKLVDAKVEKSSGDPRFDEAALAMLRRADPLPMPPPVVADDGLTFTMPVSFTLPSRR